MSRPYHEYFHGSDELKNVTIEDISRYNLDPDRLNPGCGIPHFFILTKTAETTRSKEVVNVASSDSSSISFSFNRKKHQLHATFFLQRLPTVEFKKQNGVEAEIMWCPNVATARVKNVKFSNGDFNNSMDSAMLTAYYDILSKSNRDATDVSMGRIELSEWGTTLKGFTTVLYHQLGYTEKNPYPLLFSPSLEVKQTYTLADISELIMLRIKQKSKDDDSYTYVYKMCPAELIELSYDGKKVNTIDKPTLIADYSTIPDEYLAAYHGKEEYTMTIETLERLTNATTTYEAGPTVKTITNFIENRPVKKMIVVAENVNGASINNKCNFTTCAENIVKGWNPVIIKPYSTIDGSPLIELGDVDLPDTQILQLLPFLGDLSSAHLPLRGYNVFTFDNNLETKYGDTFRVTRSTDKLALIVDNFNPTQIEEERKLDAMSYLTSSGLSSSVRKEENISYNVHVFGVVLRTITFKRNRGKNHDERIVNSYIISSSYDYSLPIGGSGDK